MNKHIKLFEEFNQARLDELKTLSGEERVTTPQEIKAANLGERERPVIAARAKMAPVYAKYEKVVAQIGELVKMRNASDDEKYDEYQNEITKLAKVRDDIDAQKKKIIDDLAKQAGRSKGWAISHLFVVEK